MRSLVQSNPEPKAKTHRDARPFAASAREPQQATYRDAPDARHSQRHHGPLLLNMRAYGSARSRSSRARRCASRASLGTSSSGNRLWARRTSSNHPASSASKAGADAPGCEARSRSARICSLLPRVSSARRARGGAAREDAQEI